MFSLVSRKFLAMRNIALYSVEPILYCTFHKIKQIRQFSIKDSSEPEDMCILCKSGQRCSQVCKSGWASSIVVGIICPPWLDQGQIHCPPSLKQVLFDVDLTPIQTNGRSLLKYRPSTECHGFQHFWYPHAKPSGKFRQ